MATRAHTITEQAPPDKASERVVRLPSAAKRKVRQRFGRQFREARDQLPSLPVQFIWPEIRAQMDDARLIRAMQRTPALALATAIFRALDEGTQRRACTYLAMMDAIGGDSAKSALALVRDRDLAERVRLDAALRRIEEGAA